MSKPRGMSVVDRVGERYGRLIVTARADNHVEPSGAVRARWHCQCDCGNAVIVQGKALSSGATRSCGCLVVDKPIKHGKINSKAYSSWHAMKQRCFNPNFDGYATYGGRGIGVCEAWVDFEGFYRDMGDPPSGMTLERIDNDKDYEPGNVRWASRLEQANNRRTNVNGKFTGISVVEYHGRKQTLDAWSRETGISLVNLRTRLNRGWTVTAALTTPINYMKGN